MSASGAGQLPVSGIGGCLQDLVAEPEKLPNSIQDNTHVTLIKYIII